MDRPPAAPEQSREVDPPTSTSTGSGGRPQVMTTSHVVTLPGQPPIQYYCLAPRPQVPIYRQFQTPFGTVFFPFTPQPQPIQSSQQGQAASVMITAVGAPTPQQQVPIRGQPQQSGQGQGHVPRQGQQLMLQHNQETNQAPAMVMMQSGLSSQLNVQEPGPGPSRSLPQQQMSIESPQARYQNQPVVLVNVEGLPPQMSNQTQGPPTTTKMELQNNVSNPTVQAQVSQGQHQDLNQAPEPMTTISVKTGLSSTQQQDKGTGQPPRGGKVQSQSRGQRNKVAPVKPAQRPRGSKRMEPSPKESSPATEIKIEAGGSCQVKEKKGFSIDLGELMGMAGITQEDCEYDPSFNYPFMQAPDGFVIAQNAPTDQELLARDAAFERQASLADGQGPPQPGTQEPQQGPNQIASGNLPTMEMKLSGLSLFPTPMEPPSTEQEEVIDDSKGDSAAVIPKTSAKGRQGKKRGKSRKSPVKSRALSPGMQCPVWEGTPSPLVSSAIGSPTMKMSADAGAGATDVKETPLPQTQKAVPVPRTSPRNRNKTAGPASSPYFVTPTAPAARAKSSSKKVAAVTVTATSDQGSPQPSTSRAALPGPIVSPARRVTRALTRGTDPSNDSSPSGTGASGGGGVTQIGKVPTQHLGQPQQSSGGQLIKTVRVSAQPISKGGHATNQPRQVVVMNPATGTAGRPQVMTVAVTSAVGAPGEPPAQPPAVVSRQPVGQVQQIVVSGTLVDNPSRLNQNQVNPHLKVLRITTNASGTGTPQYVLVYPTPQGSGGGGNAQHLGQAPLPAGSGSAHTQGQQNSQKMEQE